MNTREAHGLFLLPVLALITACSRPDNPAPAITAEPPTRAEVWAAIQPEAERYRLEASLIYALAAAESNFDPAARNGDARGLMQLKPGAWRTVSDVPYEPGVWEWRANLKAGIDYLAYLRSQLHRKGVFSYPRLIAAYHYGLDYLEDRSFDLERIPIPPNRIYEELWRDNLTPVPPPVEVAREPPPEHIPADKTPNSR